MATVTIYRINIYQSYRMEETGERFGLSPWDGDTDIIKGETISSVNYELPDGYSVDMSTGSDLSPSELTIYDANDRPCELIKHKFGRPQLIRLGCEIGEDCPVLYPVGFGGAQDGAGAPTKPDDEKSVRLAIYPSKKLLDRITADVGSSRGAVAHKVVRILENHYNVEGE